MIAKYDFVQIFIPKFAFMKYTSLLLFLFAFLGASAQTETTADTIFMDNTPVSILKKTGTGFTAYSVDGKQRFISINENYYRFPGGLVAYPDVTVRSAAKTVEVIQANGLIDKSGLNNTKIKEFISRYPTPLPVQQINRESREEVNPEIR